MVALLVPEVGKRRAVVPGSSPLQHTLNSICRADGFGGKKGEALLYHAPKGARSPRYLMIGLGPVGDLDLEGV